MSRVPTIVAEVEQRLAEFYGFARAADAADHLVTRDELKETLGDLVTTLPEFDSRAGVFVMENTDDKSDLYIGIHLDEAICAQLEAADPTERLDDGNLDAFCVLVEEISHFHLILNRVAKEFPVSKLELEWQGEIDKLLVSALTLKEQAGDLHLEALARKLYDTAVITSADTRLYWEATKYAARFWREATRAGEDIGPRVRELLRAGYREPGEDKLARLTQDLKRAS